MNFSKITDQLYIGTTPESGDYSLLHELGINLVINMRAERRPYRDPHDPPMPVLWIPTFDSPLLPIPIRSLYRGVMAALKTIESGGSVYTHCAAGVHRGVAIGSSILIGLGYPVDEAMLLIKERRKISDPHKWYIRWRIERFAKMWENLHQENQLRLADEQES